LQRQAVRTAPDLSAVQVAAGPQVLRR